MEPVYRRRPNPLRWQTVDPVASAYLKMAEEMRRKQLRNPYEELYEWQKRGGTARKIIYSMIPGTGVYEYLSGKDKSKMGALTAVIDVATTIPLLAPLRGLRGARAIKGITASRGTRMIAEAPRLAGVMKRYQALEEAIRESPKIVELGIQTSRVTLRPAVKRSPVLTLKALEEFDKVQKLAKASKPIPETKIAVQSARAIGTYRNIAKTVATSKAVQTGAKVGLAGFLASIGITKLRDTIMESIPVGDEETRKNIANALTMALVLAGGYYAYKVIRG